MHLLINLAFLSDLVWNVERKSRKKSSPLLAHGTIIGFWCFRVRVDAPRPKRLDGASVDFWEFLSDKSRSTSGVSPKSAARAAASLM